MSEARERLMDAFAQKIDKMQGVPSTRDMLRRALCHPDDLLAVLVEEGVLERVPPDTNAAPLLRAADDGRVYCRTEGNTR